MTEPSDLHPYDGKERRFRDEDVDPSQRARALALVTRLLGLPAPPPVAGLCYDMCFHSGGMGSSDRIWITLWSSTRGMACSG